MPIDDVMLGLEKMNDAFDDYEEAELYYEGTNEELFASQAIAIKLRGYEKRFRMDFAAVPVDSMTNRLSIAAVTVSGEPTEEIDEVSTEEDQRLTQLIQDEIRDANQMELVEPMVHRKTGTYGDAYVVVSPIEEVDDQGQGVVTGVSIDYNSPYEMRIVYDRSGRRKLFAIKTWVEVNDDDLEFRRVDLYYPDVIERWATKPGTKGHDPYEWFAWDILAEVPLEELPEDFVPGIEPHWFGQIPVFHFRTDLPYGRPEHKRAYGPQDMVNKLGITHMGTVDYQGFPQRFALLDPDAEEDIDESWDEDDASAQTTSESQPKLQASPGSIWWLRAKEAGQFDVASADAFLKPIEQYTRALSTVTETPIHLFDRQGQPPTGESRRTAESGQTKKLKNRQRAYGAVWREVYAFAMWLLTDLDLYQRINVLWEPAESLDEGEKWDLAAKKKAVGLPFSQILLEAGYTIDQVRQFKEEWKAEQEERIDMQRRSFQASMQERRDDRPDVPNPEAGQAESG